MFKEAVSYGAAGAVGGVIGATAGVALVFGGTFYAIYRSSPEFREAFNNGLSQEKTQRKQKRNLATVSNLPSEKTNPQSSDKN
jgi:6-phosphogluconate dehydrogenase (decarboxylating)